MVPRDGEIDELVEPLLETTSHKPALDMQLSVRRLDKGVDGCGLRSVSQLAALDGSHFVRRIGLADGDYDANDSQQIHQFRTGGRCVLFRHVLLLARPGELRDGRIGCTALAPSSSVRLPSLFPREQDHPRRDRARLEDPFHPKHRACGSRSANWLRSEPGWRAIPKR
jgi:hypothetical protein